MLKSALKSILSSIFSVKYSLMLMKLLSFGFKHGEKTWDVLLVAPPGCGNIGDQALVEAFIDNTSGRILVISRGENDINIPGAHKERVSVVSLPGLIYGRSISRVKSLRNFYSLLARSRALAVVGADIMDGAYNWKASVNRSTLAAVACELGIPSKVLGFSLNSKPNSKAVEALTYASESGVNLYLRDPVSMARASSVGLKNIYQSADMVFRAKGIDPRWAESSLPREWNGEYVIVNASGLISKESSQKSAYVDLLKHVVGLGFNVVVLPHVCRKGADDRVICRDIVEAYPSEKIFLVNRVLAPAEVRALASNAKVSVTGRMHLSVMSLYNCVPAITIGTQGKVEGLMQLFDLPELCLSNVTGEGLVRAFDSVVGRYDETVGKIKKNLPSVKELAGVNFNIA